MTQPGKGGLVWPSLAEHSRWFVVLAIVLAVVAVVVERWGGPSWVLMALGVTIAIGTVMQDRALSKAKQRDERGELTAGSTSTAHPDGTLEKVNQVSAERMGIHPSRIKIDYLRRDAESKLVRLLGEGRPTLVVGHSMVGKTRMSAQVLAEHFPNHELICPSVPGGLAVLMAGRAQPREGAVVWLDDLNRYLTDDGFRVEWLDRMVAAGALILATIRTTERARHRANHQTQPPHAELLERFTTVHLVLQP